MSVQRYLTIPDDQPLLAAIGRAAVAHAQLDYVLKLTVKTIEGRSHEDVMVDNELRGARKIRKRIAKQAEKRLGNSDAAKKLKALLDKAEKASERQNEFVRNVFGSNDQAKFWTHTESSKPFDIPSVAQLNALTEKIQLIMKELNTARRKGWLLEALDGKSPKTDGKSAKKKDKKAKSKSSKVGKSNAKLDGPIKLEDKKSEDTRVPKNKEGKVDGSLAAATVAANQPTRSVTNGTGGDHPSAEAVLTQVLADNAIKKSDDKDT
jgi:hypothetical protein